MRFIICALDEYSFSVSSGKETGEEAEEDATSFRTRVFAKSDELSWILRRP